MKKVIKKAAVKKYQPGGITNAEKVAANKKKVEANKKKVEANSAKLSQRKTSPNSTSNSNQKSASSGSKAQNTGPQTPFQNYMKIPGAVANDTVAKISGQRADLLNTNVYYGAGFSTPKAKNPKNQAALEKAFIKTYGQDYKSQIGTSGDLNETEEQYRRRMGSTYKKGGTAKNARVASKVKLTKKFKSGSIKPKKK